MDMDDFWGVLVKLLYICIKQIPTGGIQHPTFNIKHTYLRVYVSLYLSMATKGYKMKHFVQQCKLILAGPYENINPLILIQCHNADV